MRDKSTGRVTDDHMQLPAMMRLIIALLVLGLGSCLVYTILSLPTVAPGLIQTVNAQLGLSGVSNPVTAVLLNFRGYDTLLEMVVLLLALMGVWALGGAAYIHYHAPGPVLDILVQLLTPLLILVAAYLLWAGAHAPGGAFQAGSVLGAAGVLLLLAGWRPRIALMALPLRLVLILGPAAFVATALVTLISKGQLLTYPVNYAGVFILILEAAATLSIGVTLAALFVGGQPQHEQRK